MIAKLGWGFLVARVTRLGSLLRSKIRDGAERLLVFRCCWQRCLSCIGPVRGLDGLGLNDRQAVCPQLERLRPPCQGERC